MDVVHERAAGIDISKRDAKVAVRVPGKRSGSYWTTVKTFGSTTAQVLALVDYLLDQPIHRRDLLRRTGGQHHPLQLPGVCAELPFCCNARGSIARRTDALDCLHDSPLS